MRHQRVVGGVAAGLGVIALVAASIIVGPVASAQMVPASSTTTTQAPTTSTTVDTSTTSAPPAPSPGSGAGADVSSDNAGYQVPCDAGVVTVTEHFTVTKQPFAVDLIVIPHITVTRGDQSTTLTFVPAELGPGVTTAEATFTYTTDGPVTSSSETYEFEVLNPDRTPYFPDGHLSGSSGQGSSGCGSASGSVTTSGTVAAAEPASAISGAPDFTG